MPSYDGLCSVPCYALSCCAVSWLSPPRWTHKYLGCQLLGCYQVPAGRLHGMVLLRVVPQQLDAFTAKLRVHNMAPELSFQLAGVPDVGASSEALSALMQAGAWDGTDKQFVTHNNDGNSEVHRQLEGMREAGLARVRPSDPSGASGAHLWQLCMEAQRFVQVSHVLHPGRPMMAEPRDDVRVSELSAWEVILLLQKDGWQWRPAPQSVESQDKLPPVMRLEADGAITIGPKVWYSRAISIKLYYMKALLCAEQLCSRPIMPAIMIRHLQRSEYYAMLEQGSTDGQQAMPPVRQNSSKLQRSKRSKGTAAQQDGCDADNELELDHGHRPVQLPAPKAPRRAQSSADSDPKLTLEEQCASACVLWRRTQ
jgi:hypothetical protein